MRVTALGPARRLARGQEHTMILVPAFLGRAQATHRLILVVGGGGWGNGVSAGDIEEAEIPL